MKEKTLYALIALVLIISSGLHAGGSILFVANMVNDIILPHDEAVMARLEKMGFTVTHRYTKTLTGEEAKDYDYVYISESSVSGDVKDKFKNSEKPIFSCEMWIGDEMGFTGTEQNVDNGNYEYRSKKIKIVKPDHPLAGGFKGDVEVYKSKGVYGFGRPGGDVTVVATSVDDPEMAFIYSYEKGAKNKLGEPVPELRVFYFMHAHIKEMFTRKGWKLWEKAVQYAFSQ